MNPSWHLPTAQAQIGDLQRSARTYRLAASATRKRGSLLRRLHLKGARTQWASRRVPVESRARTLRAGGGALNP
jgi:hypothetical protein